MNPGAGQPTLILSQDYELFFSDSGTVEKCLFEPCDALAASARRLGLPITFFVDAGMLRCMERFARGNRAVASMLESIRLHLVSLAAAGHEIALHVHPHWEESAWCDGRWDFSGSRFRLHEFPADRIASICADYSRCLAELTGKPPTAYRAGGFCVEPFAELRGPLSDSGIRVDASVVPGAYLADPDKGFDFRRVPDDEWWPFSESTLTPDASGPFVEVPVTPIRLSAFYYWRRISSRFRPARKSDQAGDGLSRRPGFREVARRLLGRSRVAELSVDHPKADHLRTAARSGVSRGLWHVMGHPKLLSRKSIEQLEDFVTSAGIGQFETVSSFADAVQPVARSAPRARAS